MSIKCPSSPIQCQSCLSSHVSPVPILRQQRSQSICQFSHALPIHRQLNANPLKICQSITNRGTNPALNLGTSQLQAPTEVSRRRTIQVIDFQLTLARIGKYHVNPSPKTGDQPVTNLGTRLLWRPTEVSQRRTIQTINF